MRQRRASGVADSIAVLWWWWVTNAMAAGFSLSLWYWRYHHGGSRVIVPAVLPILLWRRDGVADAIAASLLSS